MYVMTDAYGSLQLFFSASLLFTLLHSGAIPPVVVKTRGLNEDFSMSITLSVFGYTYPSSPFHVVGRPLPRSSQNMTMR